MWMLTFGDTCDVDYRLVPRRQNVFCKLKIMISQSGRGARRRQKARYFSKWTLLQWRKREF